MTLLDVSSCAQTSALLGRLQFQPAKPTSSNSFWSSCAASLYTSSQFSLTSAAAASQPTLCRGVTAHSCSAQGCDRPLTQAPRTSHLSGLPCPVLYQAKEPEAISDVLRRAGKKALGGGIPGMAAMGIQVVSLMWLRTTVNYQYRHGSTMTTAFKTLYRDGGVVRFYRGLAPALFQGPLSRFGDTAANAGTLSLLESYEATAGLNVGLKTVVASAAAASFRILLMPIDATKTIMQVEGKHGFQALVKKVKTGGVPVLYHGALAASAATFVGHYPWFFTYNFLNEHLPQYDDLPRRLMRSAVIGFSASAISDTCSNSVRVVKTTKQTSTTPVTYPEVVREVIAKDGLIGLFGRGLKTKILANGLQGLMFTVLWRLGQDYWAKTTGEEAVK
ncbi:hypothetical protein ABBQ32_004054 [Trebouxia sp. C0010 RCD-2024]